MLPAGATLPILEINALGNILQNCVNSAGGSASDSTDGLTTGTPCGKLFYNTNTGTAPTDTITAALNIAQNPGLNVAKLDANQASSPAFNPALSVNTPPTDWTIAITYTGGGLSSPSAIANDANGNVWVANAGNNSVTELSNTGAAITTSTGFTGGGIRDPQGIAIDSAGNAWVANAGNNSITEIAPGLTSPLQITGNSLSTPEGIAIDGAGNIWVANNGSNSIGAFTNTGSPLTNQPYSGGGLAAPTSIAINPK
jgi:streptogramin lyase